MHAPAPGRRTPLTSYRLQLNADFTFADAARRLGYLDALGVTDLYLSPILTAAPGSRHGYDVVDPTRVSDELGGRHGFEALAAAAHSRGMGIIVDLCPNHMAISDPLWANPMLWSVLRDGPASEFVGWFDIEDDGPLTLPFLPAPLDDLLAAGRLTRATLERPDGPPEPVLEVDGRAYPLAPGTAELPLPEALDQQRYRLVQYAGFDTPLTHRRFFDIVTLIGVQQERPGVFEATHALLIDLVRAGHIDGLRIDHSDGLADPEGYFERLHAATGGVWTIAEKVLTADEPLPDSWKIMGTPGYEAAWRFDSLQLDPDGATALTDLGRELDEGTWSGYFDPDSPLAGHHPTAWEEVERSSRLLIAGTNLRVDVDRLVRLVRRIAPGHPSTQVSDSELRLCIEALLSGLDRYRTYVRPELGPDPASDLALAVAADRAAPHLPPELQPTVAWLAALAAYDPSALREAPTDPSQIAATVADWRTFVIRLQQVSGVVVGKGVEDTAFYRWPQLLTLCEVGADPTTFGMGPDQLHAWLAAINDQLPTTMVLGSTHDSKRSEDVRARVSVISEFPDEWADLTRRVAPMTDALPAPIRSIWRQTLAGTWTETGPPEADRLVSFIRKAGREQRVWTSWFTPNHEVEAEVARLIPELLADPTVRDAFDGWVRLVADSVRTNTLTTKLVQLTALGVADIYQGQETVRLSLTDPDNRRPVDFDALAAQLDAVRQIGTVPDLSQQKLLLTTTALQLRRRHPEAFVGEQAGYRPLESSTHFAWGFARGGAAVTIATRLTRANARRGGWDEAEQIALPAGEWGNLFTGATVRRTFHPAQDLGGWPCALLERIA